MKAKVDEEFERHLQSYEAATVELVNVAPAGSDFALQAIDNLRKCLELRIGVEMERSGRRESRGRRLIDYYPEVSIDRHFTGVDRRTGIDRRQAEAL